jgi:uncharacterized protein YegL
MSETDLFYLGVSCAKTGKPFYIRYNKGADKVWVRARGLKEVQLSDKERQGDAAIPSMLKDVRVSPNFSCPHCGSPQCGSDFVDLKGGKGISGPVEIMLIFDTSGSMNGRPIREAKKAANNLVKQLNLKAIKLGVAVFATSKQVAFGPINDDQKIQSGINSMDTIDVGGGTSAIPFDIAYSQFGGQGTKKYMIILTDGQWAQQSKAIEEAGKYKQKGVEIIAIGFGGVDKAFLQAIASSMEHALYTNINKLAESFSEFSLSIITGKGQ